MTAVPPKPSNDVPDVQNERRSERERGRLTAIGRTFDDGSRATLVLVHEVDRSWTFHGLGAPWVTLSEADTIALAESIPARVR